MVPWVQKEVQMCNRWSETLWVIGLTWCKVNNYDIKAIQCCNIYCSHNFFSIIWCLWYSPTPLTLLALEAGHLPHGHHHAAGAVHAEIVWEAADARTIMAGISGKGWTGSGIKRKFSRKIKGFICLIMYWGIFQSRHCKTYRVSKHWKKLLTNVTSQMH